MIHGVSHGNETNLLELLTVFRHFIPLFIIRTEHMLIFEPALYKLSYCCVGPCSNISENALSTLCSI